MAEGLVEGLLGEEAGEREVRVAARRLDPLAGSESRSNARKEDR